MRRAIPDGEIRHLALRVEVGVAKLDDDLVRELIDERVLHPAGPRHLVDLCDLCFRASTGEARFQHFLTEIEDLLLLDEATIHGYDIVLQTIIDDSPIRFADVILQLGDSFDKPRAGFFGRRTLCLELIVDVGLGERIREACGLLAAARRHRDGDGVGEIDALDVGRLAQHLGSSVPAVFDGLSLRVIGEAKSCDQLPDHGRGSDEIRIRVELFGHYDPIQHAVRL
ncbi:hypothetical protein ASG51_13885 [Methylobacterium sp. Leaf465]|uniref:hypothetical protein n=1 Tax=Methylobacterium sp. Leaf465 TaxID=1736385 RepID=UPI0006FA9BCD|nr:hypothetical protein [Methylobacterium sp. Leaf465]KQT70156.1 hypothetical protein ASG51_13885 [Methylobacterium sp. Leaf465]